MHSSTKEQLKTQAVKGEKLKASKPWYVLAGQIIAWQIAAVLFVELTLFVAGLGEEEIFKLDTDLGVTHICNKKITWRSEGFATSFLNSDGMREPGLKVAKPAGTFRVALLGDSLTESLQVPIEESFGYQIQGKLEKELGRPVQVINFGTSGYSTVQEYLQIKKKVLKYQPDLVLLCYNSRDCFENWSPPDEVLTNVRPAAIHLPGGKLTVDHTPVQQWLRTPRARFLKQFEFFREQSRIWGLYAQAELDWSLHNETYKRIALFLTRPGKAIRQSVNELSDWWKNQIASKPAKVEPKAIASSEPVSRQAAGAPSGVQKSRARALSAPTVAKAEPAQVESTSTSQKADASGPPAARRHIDGSRDPQAKPVATTKPITPSNPPTQAPAKLTANQPIVITANSSPSDLRRNYEYLIMRTLGSLFEEMKKDSASANAKFAVVALPVRSDLAATQGMPTAFNDYSYNDELIMLKDICIDKRIPLFNLHESAKSLKNEDRDSLFFLVHYTPKGHEFVAGKLTPVLTDYLKGASQP